MFGIEAGELIVLIVLAIILFGPERIPEYSRKAARVVVGLRELANNAQNQLRSELGPEYSDLTISDLHPKSFVKKHLSKEIEMIEEAKAELASASQKIKDASTELTSAATDATNAIKSPGAAEPAPVGAPFDIEAT